MTIDEALIYMDRVRAGELHGSSLIAGTARNVIVEDYDRLAKEVIRLTACLKRANSEFEKYERLWYLRGDEIEKLREAGDAVLAHLDFVKRDNQVLTNPAYYEMLATRLREAGFVARKTEKNDGEERS